jgi:Ca2+-binding RTX toxin-like protein
MQHYLLDDNSSGAYSAAALMSASGFAVDFTVTAGQQVSVSTQLADQYGASPLSVTVYNQLGGMVSTSQPYGYSYGTGLGSGAEFVASTSGLYTAVVQDSGSFTTAQNVGVSVTESGLPLIYLHNLHPEQSGPAPFAWTDTTSHQAGSADGQSYTGPVNYLQWQYLWADPDSANLSTTLPNVFLRGGPGNDALAATAGSNVLDGGTGSNFLVGASGAGGGTDTFFVDGRGSAMTWSTVTNFHPGDAVTFWGFVPGQSTMSWAASDGAAGYQGATVHAATMGAGTPVNASLTFAGMSLADAQSKLALSTGVASGIPFLYAKYVG